MYRQNPWTLRGAWALALALAMCGATAKPGVAQDIVAVPIGTFNNPVYVAVAPGAKRLLFVVERRGVIQVTKDEAPLGQPLLDIEDIVQSGGEEGLLSMAFAPDYKSSRRFYVAFTNKSGNIEINEFLRAADKQTRADPNSRRVILRIKHPTASNHNGGQLQFGPDGRLYISTGDGGAVSPTGENARDLKSLLGKILRIDPLPSDGKPYGIPDDNPFVGRPGKDEIFAYGLRNPWRFSFDGKRIAIADVGHGKWEEVNILRTKDAAGVNFGWPQFEANEVFDNSRPGPHPPVFPMFAYDHNGGGCAVIGGYVVRDPDLPDFVGRYVYGDACTGDVRSFVPKVGAQEAKKDKPTGVILPGLSSFGQGHGGKLYAAQLSGTVSRFAPAP